MAYTFRLAATRMIVAGILLSGCGMFGDDESVKGLWTTNGTDLVFLEITTNRMVTYDYQADDFDGGEACYMVYVANIVSTNDNEYTVSSDTQPSLRIRVTLELVDGNLTVTSDGISESFVRSDRDVASLTPRC